MLAAVSAQPRPSVRGSPDRHGMRTPVVVCGVDNARDGNELARFAAGLIRQLGGGRLILLSVRPPELIEAEPLVEYAGSKEERSGIDVTTARELARLALDAGMASSTEIRVGYGDPERRLVETAREVDAAFVVVGSRVGSRAGIRGRLATRVIRRAGCPVIVVPVAGAPGPVASRGGGEVAGSILCGVDGSNSSRAVLRLGAQLARTSGRRLVAAHVVQPPVPSSGFGLAGRQYPVVPVQALLASGTSRLERILEEEELGDADRRVLFGYAPGGLASIAREEGAELIVVGSRGHGAFKAALLGSVSSDLIGAARCPVVVLPPGRAAGPETSAGIDPS